MLELFIVDELGDERLTEADLRSLLERKLSFAASLPRAIFANGMFTQALRNLENVGWIDFDSDERTYSLGRLGQERRKAARRGLEAMLGGFVEEGDWPAFRAKRPDGFN